MTPQIDVDNSGYWPRPFGVSRLRGECVPKRYEPPRASDGIGRRQPEHQVHDGRASVALTGNQRGAGRFGRRVRDLRDDLRLALTQLRLRNLLRTGRNQLTLNPEALKQFKCAPKERVESVA